MTLPFSGYGQVIIESLKVDTYYHKESEFISLINISFTCNAPEKIDQIYIDYESGDHIYFELIDCALQGDVVYKSFCDNALFGRVLVNMNIEYSKQLKFVDYLRVYVFDTSRKYSNILIVNE